jgi:hypothetical protein
MLRGMFENVLVEISRNRSLPLSMGDLGEEKEGLQVRVLGGKDCIKEGPNFGDTPGL